jgi:hypothetical protein
MPRDQWADVNAMIDDYRVHRLTLKQVARKYQHGIREVTAMFRDLRLTRPRSEASQLAWTPERRERQARDFRERHIGGYMPRTIERTRTQSVHDLAVWFQRCKEITGLYPDAAQVDGIIEQIRVWNGGNVKPQKREVAV